MAAAARIRGVKLVGIPSAGARQPTRVPKPPEPRSGPSGIWRDFTTKGRDRTVNAEYGFIDFGKVSTASTTLTGGVVSDRVLRTRDTETQIATVGLNYRF